MEFEAFVKEVLARGGECAVWLVYLANRIAELEGAPAGLLLQGAFFTRGEAYAFAQGARKARLWQHFYVFRLQVDSAWLTAGTERTAEFEMAFGRIRTLPDVSVTPTQLAKAMAS